ncbi:MAG: PhoH family protein [Puniceicoccales bacterium]|jgi:PhoH-like ATPase|nr:PhoH family protein [Puniceicoccales bacterium]
MSSPKKTYVLDTNVLLHDPQSLFKFDEHSVAIPVEVLSELDNKKTAPGAVGANARQVNRELRRLFDKRRLEAPAGNRSGTADALVAPLESGGQILIVVNQQLVRKHFDTSSESEHLRTIFPDKDKPDHRIIAATLYLRTRQKGTVVLVTKDACMALKARALGLEVEDYRNDRVETEDAGEYASVQLSASAMERFEQTGDLTLDRLTNGQLHANEYVMLECGDRREPACFTGEKTFRALPLYREFHSGEPGARRGVQLPRGVRVVPKNYEQWIFMDALLDPEIRLVTCFGRAGTGKTFISIAAALAQVLSEFTQYKKLYISRPVVQIGRDIGALPGTKDEKLSPYVQPYFDNLEVLFSQNTAHAAHEDLDTTGTTNRRKKKNHAAKARIFGHPGTLSGAFTVSGGVSSARKPYQWLLDSGLIEIEAMTFIRGRSIGNAFMIVDEAQNMTPHEAKTVITRMAEGSKLVLIGDLEQVDTPYLDSKTNGLIHAHEHMKGHAITAHVRLLQGVRSRLSELAANRM